MVSLARLLTRCHLITNNNPGKQSLRVKFCRSILVSIVDGASKSEQTQSTAQIANRRSGDIDGEVNVYPSHES